jgi:hypothetical protein
MSWPMLLIEKHYPWQYRRGTKKERDFKYMSERKAARELKIKFSSFVKSAQRQKSARNKILALFCPPHPNRIRISG